MSGYRSRVIVKTVPCSGSLSTITSPPCACTISYTIDKPNPVPPGLVVYTSSNIRASSPAGMPLPLSCT
jgi:hypothetical protein